MIMIIATTTLKPGCKEDYLVLAKELVEKSRQEEGCLSYRLFESQSDPNGVVIVEEWKDEQAIAQHNASEHFTRIVPQFDNYRTGPFDVTLYNQIV